MTNFMRYLSKFFVVSFLLLFLLSCSVRIWHPFLYQAGEYVHMDRNTPAVKCHMTNGELYLLSQWSLDKANRQIKGLGVQYDMARNIVDTGDFVLSFDDVALIETNVPEQFASGPIGAMGLMTGISLFTTGICIANPKACFGSCPTIYANNGSEMILQAEGFSASVARRLEATDIDALYIAEPVADKVELLVTNEALETHAIRHMRLIALPRPAGGRVYRDVQNRFYGATNHLAPSLCTVDGQDVTGQFTEYDEDEYYSCTDEENLASKETLEVEFPATSGKKGLVISSRNSLLNTFLIYQTLSYMGESAGKIIANLETTTADFSKQLNGIGELLGRIEIFVFTADGQWEKVGELGETGPIAREMAVQPLGEFSENETIRVRLVICKGNWRIDHLALVDLTEEIQPIVLDPVKVAKYMGESDDTAFDLLRDENEYLFTYPGDSYSLIFQLPENLEQPELFVESTGYYYEWIREAWLKEENPQMLTRILFNPEEVLKDLAGPYKAMEAGMEKSFWNSRYGRE